MNRTKTRQVRFRMDAEPGRQVFLAGTFNGWDPRQTPMRENSQKGTYCAAVALPSGCHEYKFVVDGEWQVDPKSHAWVPNGVGSLNSVVVV